MYQILKKFKTTLPLLSLFVFLLFSGAICRNSGSVPDPITLRYWRVLEDETVFGNTFASFRAAYPYVNIEYKKLTLEEFEQEYFEAWAQGEGPDIFSVPSTYLGKYKNFMEPLPSALTTNEVSTTQSLGRKQTLVKPVTVRTPTLQEIRAKYVDTVANDIIFTHQTENEQPEEKIFGLPLSMDTLALYYNKDLLNQAQISLPPQTWEEFYADVKKITALDKDNNVIISGAALGTSENVPRSFDILSILMMQNGATMEKDGRIEFQAYSPAQEGYLPGLAAVQFYTSFASPEKDAYSWNESMPNALEAFAQGKVAFFLGYHYNLDQIKKLNSTLNFDVVSLPQVSLQNKVNYPSYWVEGVSRTSQHTELAWKFLLNLTKENNIKTYLQNTGNPTALKSLIPEQSTIYTLRPFVEQALTAKNWYHGEDFKTAEQLFEGLINGILEGKTLAQELLNQTAEKIQLTL